MSETRVFSPSKTVNKAGESKTCYAALDPGPRTDADDNQLDWTVRKVPGTDWTAGEIWRELHNNDESDPKRKLAEKALGGGYAKVEVGATTVSADAIEYCYCWAEHSGLLKEISKATGTWRNKTRTPTSFPCRKDLIGEG